MGPSKSVRGELKSDKLMSSFSSSHGRDELVISGISGRFPESENLQEFSQNLFGGIDMITDDGRRWTPGLNGLPTRSGKLKTLDKFDAQFFGVHPKQANFMDPQLRMLLEVTHEAIIDAGVNPVTVRGTRTGVFVGASGSESEKIWLRDSDTKHGYALTGCNRGMFSNRVSFAFDFQGPSFTVDTACSSSFIALEQAVAALRLGHCDAAIVGGVHVCLEPNMSLQFHRLSMLSPEGKCRSFDSSGNGYVRSEAAVAIFIQKKDFAFRFYASILAARTNTDGHKEAGVTFPSGQRQAELLEETYREAKIDPRDVVYVEAHGTGTAAGDPQELNAIASVFCKGRDKSRPLLIGSVKSNCGHSEPASGLCSMAKVLLAMQKMEIPGNLHFKSPNPNIPALCDGRLQVVAKNTPWNGGIVGLNSFGFGGANVHVVLKSNPKNLPTKVNRKPENSDPVPFIIPYSGRTRESVQVALAQIGEELNQALLTNAYQVEHIKLNHVQLERLSLLHRIAQSDIPGHTFRGFSVLHPDPNLNQNPIVIDIEENVLGSSSVTPPVWFVFSGMGSQWPAMGQSLLVFKAFRDSILDLAEVLKPHNLDLVSILLDKDENSLNDSVLKCFVAIASTQIALVDLLRSVNIKPQGIIGHSVGELVAAYADGCFSAHQTVLAALARGKAIMKLTNEVKMSMAAVGLTWDQAKLRCPPTVFPACHNSADSVTVSGPAADITVFVEKLKSEGIFAKEVNSSGQAFHSKYIEKARPHLKAALDALIPVPVTRSSKWISSSIPESEWSSPLAQLSSADYHVKNLISPVLFQEALKHVPKSAVVIEIGPHCLLQAILKRSLPTCTNIGLVNRNHQDNAVFFVQALGKIYNAGVNPDLSSLYPKVEFPVSVQTPSLGHLVKWDHSLSWDVPSFAQDHEGGLQISEVGSGNPGEVIIEVSLGRESDLFYEDHKIDGRIIFPATGYFLLIWKAFARLQKKPFDQVPIVLENVTIVRATVLPLDGAIVKFHINIFQGSGEFQIQESDFVIVTGRIRSPNGNEFLPLEPPPQFIPDSTVQRIPLSKEDAYKELRLRGYEYSGTFQGIQSADNEGGWAKLQWNGNWVSFLDTVLQVAILSKNTRALYLPTYLDKAIFDPQAFLQSLQAQVETDGQISPEELQELHQLQQSGLDKINNVPIFNYPDLTVVTCEGIQFQRWKAGMAPRRNQATTTSNNLRLEKFQFTPYFDRDKSPVPLPTDLIDVNPRYALELENCLSICMEIVLENIQENTLKMLEILGRSIDCPNPVIISPIAQSHILNQPTKLCSGKAIVLGQRSKVKEALEKADIRVTIPKPDNELEVVEEMSSACDLLIIDESRFLEDPNEATAVMALRDQGFLLYHTPILGNRKNGVKNNKNGEKYDFNVDLDFGALEDCLGLILVSHKVSSVCNFYLFKKSLNFVQNFRIVDKEIDGASKLPKFIPVEIDLGRSAEVNYSWVEDLKTALKKAVEWKNRGGFRIYLISRENPDHPQPSGVLGLVNTLRKEPGGDKLRCFFIRNSPLVDKYLDFSHPSDELSLILQRDLAMNVFQNNVWGSYRFCTLPPLKDITMSVDHAYLNVITRGDLSSLRWFESPLKYHKTRTEICEVYYAPLNFRDVMLCTGKLALDSLPNNLGAQECVLGLEWAGKNVLGDRVMGVVQTCGMATSVVPDIEFYWDVPKDWTLAEAATVPVAWSTAYYALVVRGKMQRGESILIHAGAGAVGSAAIKLALSMGCQVFTSVGSQEKRDYLKQLYPQLTDSSFSNSRDTSFLEHILRETNGLGVDLVLNSLAGDKLQASIKCLAYQGRFLEIGKVDLFKNSSLGMSVLLKNVSVHGILLDGLISGDPDKTQIQKLVAKGLESGLIQPLNSTIFTDSNEDVENAFRFMATGKHIGKILIEIRKEEGEESGESQKKTVLALPKTHFDPKKAYIIIGGLGGFGCELAGWLVERGARKLALVSRSGVKTGFQDLCLRRWRRSGATIITPRTDVTKVEVVTSLFKEVMSSLEAEIGGIYNLAMVLADGLMEKQTPETFDTVSRPKVNSTVALDKVSRQLAPSLDYFVVFSSVSSGRGAAGLGNYAWANSAMERICENRQNDGLPALAIQWGAVGDVGVLQEEKGMGNEAVVGGTSPQRIASCLNTLDILLYESKQSQAPVLSSMVLSGKRKKKESGNSMTKSGSSANNLVEKVGHILGIKPDAITSVNSQMKLYEMGMDSLMIVEIKQLVEMMTGISLSNTDMLELTFEKIKNFKSESSSSAPPPSTPAPPPTPRASIDIPLDTEHSLKKFEDSSSSSKENLNDHHSSEEPADLLKAVETALADGTTGGTRQRRKRQRNFSQASNSSANRDLPRHNGVLPIMENSRQNSTRPGIPAISSILESTLKDSEGGEYDEDLHKVSHYIKSAYRHFQSVLIVLLLGVLFVISLILRLGIKLYLKIFHDPNDIKLLDRPYDQVCANNPRTSNMAFALRFQGVPLKSKIVRTLDERVINWKTNITFEQDSSDLGSVAMYQPYEALRWRIKEGFLFHYWKRDRSFNVADHVVVEQIESGADVESAALRASEFYHNHKWQDYDQRKSRPQWEFRIISPKYGLNFPADQKEFVIVFAAHHSYGDAYSCLHMLQYALSDVKPPLHHPPPAAESKSKSTKSRTKSGNFVDVPDSSTFFNTSGGLLARGKELVRLLQHLVLEISRVREVSKENTTYCQTPGARRYCGVAKYSLTQMKSVLSRSGHPVPVTSVILTIVSKVYERLYAEYASTQGAQRKPVKKIPKSLMAFLPYAVFPYKRLGLLNNFANSYTTIPLGHMMDNVHETMTTIQRSVEESSARENLEASWITTCLMSLLANPLSRLGFAFLPSPAMLYTNVPATIPRHMTFFGGYKIKDFFGFTMLLLKSNATLASTIDSSNDSVSLSLVVDDSAMEICPNFLERYFLFFQQELDNLVNETQFESDDESELTEDSNSRPQLSLPC